MDEKSLGATIGAAVLAVLTGRGLRARKNGGGKTYRVELSEHDRELLVDIKHGIDVLQASADRVETSQGEFRTQFQQMWREMIQGRN